MLALTGITRRRPSKLCPLQITSPSPFPPTDVGIALTWIHAREAAGPHGIPGHVLKACAWQLTGIFQLSLAQAAVPTCFKTTSIVPEPKHSTAASDFRPATLTPIIMKFFERLVLAHLKTYLPATHTGPTPILLPPKQVYRRRHLHSASLRPLPPRQ